MDALQKVGMPYAFAFNANVSMQEISSIDNDMKNKYNQYNQVKTQLTVIQRRQTYARFDLSLSMS